MISSRIVGHECVYVCISRRKAEKANKSSSIDPFIVWSSSIVYQKAHISYIVSFIVAGVKNRKSRREKENHPSSSPPPLSSSTALFFEKNET